MRFRLNKEKSISILKEVIAAETLVAVLLAGACSTADKNKKIGENSKPQKEKIEQYAITYRGMEGKVEFIDFVTDYIDDIPTLPDSDNYIFDGWYLNNSPYNFKQVVKSDIELNAHFIPKKSACYFDIENIIKRQNGAGNLNNCYLHFENDSSTLFLYFSNVKDALEVTPILLENKDGFSNVDINIDIGTSEDAKLLQELPKDYRYKLNIFGNFKNQYLDLKNVSIMALNFYEDGNLSQEELKEVFTIPNIDVSISSNIVDVTILNQFLEYGKENTFNKIEIGIEKSMALSFIDLPAANYTIINNGYANSEIVVKSNSNITVLESDTDDFQLLVPDNSLVYLNIYNGLNLNSKLMNYLNNAQAIYLMNYETCNYEIVEQGNILTLSKN